MTMDYLSKFVYTSLGQFMCYTELRFAFMGDAMNALGLHSSEQSVVN